MKDLIHEKFAKLMNEVETLEEDIEQQETAKNVSEQELLNLKEKLAELRNELKRLSDGCGIH